MLDRRISNSLRQYFSNLSSRDQRMLKVLAAFLMIVIAWLGIWVPINNSKSNYRMQYLVEASNIDWMRTHAAAVKNKQPVDTPAMQQNSTALLTNLSNSATQHQITIEHAEATDENHFQIAISNTTFANLLTWLNALKQELRLHCPQITIERAADREGLTTANLTLVF